jgi:hydroxyacylglutathione hydrolase
VYFQQFYLGCLAQASYMIGDGGEAVVVDPRRDVEVYVEEAAARGLTIRHVIETHVHADFVSGHRELADRVGATIWVSPEASAGYPHRPAEDGAEIRVGQVRLRFLATPGHTLDSISLLVFEAADSPAPAAVLTGDTLFIGDVGRPDLAASVRSPRDQAGMLYDSLHQRLLTLPDAVVVYPGHGAGSMCGRNLSKETSSTIGEQRRTNYALQPMPREAFIDMMTTDLPEIPGYFGRDVRINRDGPPILAQRKAAGPLSVEEVERLGAGGAVVLDTRSPAAFGNAHVAGSVNIGLDGQFASWAGTVLPAVSSLVLVTDGSNEAAEAEIRLARVGLENVRGYLEGGIAAWHDSGRPLARTEQISVAELAERLREGECRVIDVRRPTEWTAGHIGEAMPSPLAALPSAPPPGPREEPVAVICAGGYRSAIASSLLERQGFSRIANVVGGMAAWSASGLPVVAA